MPYTKPLTEAGKEAERQRKRTDIFREAYGGRKAVAGFKDYEIASLIGYGESTIRRWLKKPGPDSDGRFTAADTGHRNPSGDNF